METLFGTEGRNRTGTNIKYSRDFKSLVSTSFTTSAFEASTRFELVNDSFADCSLTTWVRRQKKASFKRPRAKERIRTVDPHVGNVMLYQLSYFRNNFIKKMMLILTLTLTFNQEFLMIVPMMRVSW